MLQVIPIPPAGYTVPTLKDALGQAIAYIRLLQKNLILSACLLVCQLTCYTVCTCYSPSRRREAPCEGTNSPRLFTPGKNPKGLAKSKVHQ
jgi:hypothetical protein